MKYLIRFLFLILVYTIIQCAPPVVFDKPYPPNEDDLTTIPTKYHGVYMCQSDSTLVFINDLVIYAREAYYFEDSIENIEAYEDCTLIDGKLIINKTGEEVPIEFVDENIIRGHFIEQDTLFNLKEEIHARPYNDDLILSKAFKEGEWALFVLSKDNNDIIYRAINEATDLDLVNEITQMTPIDTDDNEPPRYIVSPTLVEFDRLLKSEKIFIECDKLIKVQYDEFKKDVF